MVIWVSGIKINSHLVFVSPQNILLFHLSSVYSHPINRSLCGESGELSWYKLVIVLQGPFFWGLEYLFSIDPYLGTEQGIVTFYWVITFHYLKHLVMCLSILLLVPHSLPVTSLAIPLTLLVFMEVMASWLLRVKPHDLALIISGPKIPMNVNELSFVTYHPRSWDQGLQRIATKKLLSDAGALSLLDSWWPWWMHCPLSPLTEHNPLICHLALCSIFIVACPCPSASLFLSLHLPGQGSHFCLTVISSLFFKASKNHSSSKISPSSWVPCPENGPQVNEFLLASLTF